MFKIVLVVLIASLVIVINGDNRIDHIDCSRIKCDLNVKCKKDASLKYVNSTACCPECVCDDKCPELSEQLCSFGFKPIKQAKLDSECCEIIACISNTNNNDDLTFQIDDSQSNEFKQDNSNDYLLEHDDDDHDNEDNVNDVDIIEDDSYLNETSNNDSMCVSYKCTNEKYKYYKHNLKCPKDSQLADVNLIEKQCCHVDKSCVCNECPDRSEMIEWCKLAGTNFEAVIVQKGENIPGKCCDVHICHSPNYTCNLNGIFYPHNSKWKLNTCTDCTCEMGHIKCNKISCPVLDCEIKQALTNECCPICTGECLGTDDKIYKSNQTWKLEDDDCIQCTCVNGQKECLTESCPPLNCLNPIKIPGVCCRQCSEQDILTHKRYLKYPPHCKAKTETKCNTTCSYGFKLDGNRCPSCECSDQPIEKCSFKCDLNDLTYMPLNDRLCECSIDKCPVNQCFTKCLNGYEKDSFGCDTCKCKEDSNKCLNVIEENKIWNDKCRECTCKNNQEFCSLISCRKLTCLNPIYSQNSCCPYCPDEQPMLEANVTTCTSNKQIYIENDLWQLDKCTNCSCRNGLLLCSVNECEPVACLNPIYSKETCCPMCPLTNQTIKPYNKKYWSCIDSNNELKSHGSTWKENDCLHCVCQNGERRCFNQETQCPKLNCLATITLKGECCARCLLSLNSPFLLSLISNSTSQINFKETNYNTKIHQNHHIIYFLALVVISLVILVIVLLLKLLGITYQSGDYENDFKKTKLIKKSTQTSLPIHSPLLFDSSSANQNRDDHFNNSNSSELSFNQSDDNSKSTLLLSNEEKTTSFNPTHPIRSICYI